MNKKQKKQMRIRWIWITVLIVVSALLIFLPGRLEWVREESGYFQAILTLLSIGFAGLGIYFQMQDSRKLQQAEFVMHLNQSFVENPDYAYVYTQLEREAGTDKSAPAGKISRIQMSNYLTFFESMYLLVIEKAIQMRMLNDLFGYRFFLAVHSPLIQKVKLVSQPSNFKNIYYLEKIWMEYRLQHGLSVYNMNDCLEKACERAGKKEEYDRIMADMDGLHVKKRKAK